MTLGRIGSGESTDPGCSRVADVRSFRRRNDGQCGPALTDLGSTLATWR